MKNITKLILGVAGMAVGLLACKKEPALMHYASGTASTLSASTNVFKPAPADSSSTALTLNWTDPGYAADSTTTKYVIQVDSAGKNFSKAQTVTVTGAHSVNLTAKQVNDMLLSLGFNYNVTYSADVRLISSYANNNDAKVSNVITLTVTPYVVPPKVTPPSTKALYLVGSATAGGWGANPVPVSQQFTRVDSVTYEGTFYLNGGGEYLMLPLNGNWDHKYSVANKTLAGLSDGGDFGADLSDNFPGPAATGTYKIHVDFQHGTFSVTQVKAYGLLYVPGDYQGWAPATARTLGSTNNDGTFDGYVNIPTGNSGEFKFTPAPTWDNSYGDLGGGKMTLSGGGNFKVETGKYYHIKANTNDNTYSITPTTWGIIGSFAASGWGSDVPMTYDANNGVWKATITVADGDQFKFRANGSWDLNYGDNGGGKLEEGGGNIGDATKNTTVVKAGTYTVTLFLNNAGYYTYLIQ